MALNGQKHNAAKKPALMSVITFHFIKNTFARFGPIDCKVYVYNTIIETNEERTV